MNVIPVIMLVMPLLACLAIALGLPARRSALAAAVVNVLLAGLLAFSFPTGEGGYHFVAESVWLELPSFFTITFITGVDGLSLPMVILSAVILLAALGVAPEGIRREREFFICTLLIGAGALGAFLSLDLFFLYVFHELALIPTFLMVGIWGGQDRRFAAAQMTLYLAAASLVLLAGLLAFYFGLPADVRSLDLRHIADTYQLGDIDPGAQGWAALLLIIGFGALVSIWPLHSWAPKGYAAAPASTSMLHAAVLKKFGIYGLLRIAVPYLPEGMEQWTTLVLVLLLANILYIGLVTIAQKDLGMMLGYSSVMHMGFLFLGLISGTILGLGGTVLLMVGHGLSAALLFGLAAAIRERTGTWKFAEMGGLATKAPVLAFLFILGMLAAIGTPGLGNFAGEIIIFFGAWTHHPVWTAMAVWGVVISAVYGLRAVRAIFHGEPTNPVAGARDLENWSERWPFVMLAAGLVLVGVLPKIILNWVTPVFEAMPL